MQVREVRLALADRKLLPLRGRKLLLTLACGAVALSGVRGSATAANISWSGLASGSAWFTGTDWVGGVVPANSSSADTAVFDQLTYASQPNAFIAEVNGIVVGDGTTLTAPLTLGGNQLTLGGGGISVLANAGGATISAPVVLAAGQTWTNASASPLAITGTVTRSAGSTLHVVATGTGQITSTALSNDATGIIGPWATFGSGTATQYAMISGGAFAGYNSGTAVTTANALVSATTNYNLTLPANSGAGIPPSDAVATSNIFANTILFTGSSDTDLLLGNDDGLHDGYTGLTPTSNVSLTLSGVINAGPGLLRFRSGNLNSGGIIIGASLELDLDAAGGNIRMGDSTDYNDDPAIVIHDNAAGASSVVIDGSGGNYVVLKGHQLFSGGLTINNGGTVFLEQSVGSSSRYSLGSGTITLNAGATIYNGNPTQGVDYSGYGNAQIWNGNFAIHGINPVYLGDGAITMNSNITIDFTVAGDGEGGWGGINDGGHGYGLTIAGSTTAGYRLEGADTFTGAFNIDSGYILVTNSQGLNRDMTVSLNAGSNLGFQSTYNTMAGINDGPSGGGKVYGNNFIFAGTGNYSFSGQLTSVNYQDSKIGTGTQTLSGLNTFGGDFGLAAGTLILDFSGPIATAPAQTSGQGLPTAGVDILYHNSNPEQIPVVYGQLSLAGGTLRLSGAAGAANVQHFGSLSVGNLDLAELNGNATGRTGSSKVILAPADGANTVLLSFGTIVHQGFYGGVSVNFALPAGTQNSTNGVLSTVANTNGIIGGVVTVTTASGTDWAVSNATQISGVAWSLDGDDNTVQISAPGLTNGAGVSFSNITADDTGDNSTLANGQLYYVVGAGASLFKVVSVSGRSTPVIGLGGSGTLTVNIQGNIVPLTSYSTFVGAGSTPTGNYLLTGSGALTATETVNSLKITTTGPGQSLDLGVFGLIITPSDAGLGSLQAGGILFTGADDYEIKNGQTGQGFALSANGPYGETIIQQYGTGNLTISAELNYSNNALTKVGPGTLTVTGLNEFSGPVYLDEGIFNFNSINQTASALGTGTVLTFGGGTLQYATGYTADSGDISTRTVSFAPSGGTIDTNGFDVTYTNGSNNFGNSGFGGFTKAGVGTLTLNGYSTYEGGTTITGGTLSISALPDGSAANSALGSSSPDAVNLILNGGTLQYTGTATSTNRNFTLGASGGGLDASGASNAALVFSNTSAIAFSGTGARTLTLSGSSTGANTLNNAIGDAPGGASPTSVLKTGAGTWILTSGNTYSGGTTVNDGTLLVQNAAGSGNVTMNGGTLGGSGWIAGTVVGGTGAHTIAPSATLVGNTATTLTLGGLTSNSNTTLAFNLNTPYNTITHAASVSDEIVVDGTVDLTGGGALSITNTNTGQPSLGYYKAIAYTRLTAPSSPTANLGITMPTVANGIAYVLDTSHDPGYIDIHRGFLGDANDDGIVNAIDLGILATNYNSTTANWSEGDYNGDGIVNAIDLGILATNYNAVIGAGSFDAAVDAYPTLEAALGGATNVPEPASLALLGIGAAGLLTRRRRRA